MNKVYIILQKDLKERNIHVFGVFSKKENAKKIVDRLNKQNAYDVEDMDYDYILESYDVDPIYDEGI